MICYKCNGAGSYQYSTHGTPHFKPCEVCCKHDKGYWHLHDYYGEDNNKWACRAGCGHILDDEPDDNAIATNRGFNENSSII